MSEASKRRVTYAQLETLWEFLNSHRDLAAGYNKTAQARERAKTMWMRIAQALNSHGEAAVKDWKGWNKYWNDYKSKLKKAVANIRASQQRTGGGPPDTRELTEIELKFLQILGDSFGTGLPGARVEPFNEVPEEGLEVEIEDDTLESIHESSRLEQGAQPSRQLADVVNESSQLGQGAQPSIQLADVVNESSQHGQEAQPRPSRQLADVVNESSQLGQEAQPRPSRQLADVVNENSQLGQGAQPRPPRPLARSHLSPQRRRRQRQNPLSQEQARRQLIALSIERKEQDKIKINVLQQLVQELRDIKETLRTRLPVPDLPDTPTLHQSE